ncbi:MAG: branched-chain amino acid ABC transporter permease, partial [Candidatus Bathyarchaeia archaeon]
MFETIIGAFLYAIVLASIYSLATMGLNLIFGVMKIVNFAHADFLTFGGYIAYWSWALLSFNPITSIPISALIGFIAGLSIFNVLIRKLIQTSSESTIIVTFSLGLVFQESMKTLWTADYRGTPWTLGNISFLSVSIPVTYIIVTLTGIIGIFCMYTILYKTYFGKSLRAIICNSDAAAICGVRVMHTLALGFALG